MINENLLAAKLQEIKSNIQKNHWKYYHIESVENFVFHLGNFKNPRTKERMADEIEKYLDTVTVKIHEEKTVHEKAKELFPVIWKISETYKLELHFIHKPGYFVPAILFIILVVLLKTSFTTFIAFGVSTFVFSCYGAYAHFKKIRRKVF